MTAPEMDVTVVDTDAIEAAMAHILAAPAEVGTVVSVVRRPADGEREVLEVGELSLTEGLVGDNWKQRGSRRTPDGSANPDMQLNIMGSRFLAAICPDPARRALAGDQLHVDLDLSAANLPPGTRLQVGDAVVEVTAEPHTGCAKFVQRFGRDAMRYANSERGMELRMRGLNAKVVVPGQVRPGDDVRKLPPS